jgi:hypothetical protein
LENTDKIYQFLRYGRNDSYAKCPEFNTERFQLRQVRDEDAEELLSFYGDLSEWIFFSYEMSNNIFASVKFYQEGLKSRR